ncbi:putative molybdenum carrier protein [bacterium]|nr:putative molybdenum carrier protein [bacterium]
MSGSSHSLPIRIVSGGQTGVDRAALDVALELGIPCGGWCPKGRCAEDGPLPERYPLHETPSEEYAQRTEWNVRDSGGTLILARGELTGGTALTVELARRYDRPCLVMDLSADWALNEVCAWIEENEIHTLNIAGPRESGQPGIADQAMRFLRLLLA